MLLRLLITFGVVGGLGLFWVGWQQYKRGVTRAIRPAGEGAGKPTLLYFSADYCAPCKFQQAPIVERVAERLGDRVRVQRVDVTRQPDLARRYKILTLPATVVLDAGGAVRHINYGVADQTRLERQLQS